MIPNNEIVFTGLKLRNFMSFGNADVFIDLTIEGTILINGVNIDVGGANGVGKTTMINAICFAIYNKPFDNISLQRLINNTNATKDTLMEVTLCFTKGSKEYEVYRCRGSSTNIKIFCDGTDVTLDSIANNDKFVEDLIGMSYELFTNVIVFAGSMRPFLERPIGEQRKLIEELFIITILSEKAVKLKEKIKITEGDINIQEAIINERKKTRERYEKQLNDAAERAQKWDDDKAQKIETIQQKIEQLKTSSASSVNIEFYEEREKDRQILEKEINDVKKSIDSLNRDLDRNKKDASKIEKELIHLNDSKCPYCLQKYENSQLKINDLKKELGEITVQKQSLSDNVKEQDSVLGDLKAAHAVIIEEIGNVRLQEVLDAEAEAKILPQKLKDIQDSQNPHIDALEKLVAEGVDSSEENDTETLDKLKSKLEHQQFLVKLLIDKNSFIRRKIINRTIPFLNDRLNYYTRSLGLPHLVMFDDDMSCTVSEFGRELDFGNLSNGEKRRVNLAMSLSFRDVIHHLHHRFNLLFIDEIDNGLDSPGVEAIVKVIKQKSRDDDLAIWVISHRPEVSGQFKREVTIKKEMGFSSIEF